MIISQLYLDNMKNIRSRIDYNVWSNVKDKAFKTSTKVNCMINDIILDHMKISIDNVKVNHNSIRDETLLFIHFKQTL